MSGGGSLTQQSNLIALHLGDIIHATTWMIRKMKTYTWWKSLIFNRRSPTSSQFRMCCILQGVAYLCRNILEWNNRSFRGFSSRLLALIQILSDQFVFSQLPVATLSKQTGSYGKLLSGAPFQKRNSTQNFFWTTLPRQFSKGRLPKKNPNNFKSSKQTDTTTTLLNFCWFSQKKI